MSDHADTIRDGLKIGFSDHFACSCSSCEKVRERLAALDLLVAERDEARRERDSWRKLAEGWKLTDDVERHRV